MVFLPHILVVPLMLYVYNVTYDLIASINILKIGESLICLTNVSLFLLCSCFKMQLASKHNSSLIK